MTNEEGDVYEGFWLNDKANGQGIFIKNDGSKFLGSFVEDK